MANFDRARVGDSVAIVESYGFRGYVVARFSVIEKVTPTQVTAFNGKRFMRASGRAVGDGDSWRQTILQWDTPELRARVAQSNAFAAAEKKCIAWAEKLKSARAEDAVEMAAMLPDLTEGKRDD